MSVVNRQSRRKAKAPEPGIYTVYCDESGFTGNNLLDKSQPVFAYAAVAIEPESAEAILQTARSSLGVSQDRELKASSSIDRPKEGRSCLRL